MKTATGRTIYVCSACGVIADPQGEVIQPAIRNLGIGTQCAKSQHAWNMVEELTSGFKRATKKASEAIRKFKAAKDAGHENFQAFERADPETAKGII